MLYSILRIFLVLAIAGSVSSLCLCEPGGRQATCYGSDSTYSILHLECVLTVEKLQILQSASFNCKDFRPDNASIPRLREIIFDSVEGCFCMCLFPQNITTRCDNSKIYCPQKSCQCNKKPISITNGKAEKSTSLTQSSKITTLESLENTPASVTTIDTIAVKEHTVKKIKVVRVESKAIISSPNTKAVIFFDNHTARSGPAPQATSLSDFSDKSIEFDGRESVSVNETRAYLSFDGHVKRMNITNESAPFSESPVVVDRPCACVWVEEQSWNLKSTDYQNASASLYAGEPARIPSVSDILSQINFTNVRETKTNATCVCSNGERLLSNIGVLFIILLSLIVGIV